MLKCTNNIFLIWPSWIHSRMKHAPFLITGLLLITAVVHSQNDYRLSWKKEGVLGGSAVIMGSTALWLYSSMSPLNEQEVSGLRSADLNFLDRGAVGFYSGKADRWSDLGQDGPLVLAATASCILPLVRKENEGRLDEAIRLIVLWGEVNLISSTATHLTKNGIRRPRPYAYNPGVSMEQKTTRSVRQSFLSGHAVTSAANSFYLATLFSDYYPESRYTPIVWGVAAIIPAWTCVERVIAGRHFPTDVMAGYGFGALCGILVPRMHRISRSKFRAGLNHPFTLDMIPVPVPSGAGMNLMVRF